MGGSFLLGRSGKIPLLRISAVCYLAIRPGSPGFSFSSSSQAITQFLLNPLRQDFSLPFPIQVPAISEGGVRPRSQQQVRHQLRRRGIPQPNVHVQIVSVAKLSDAFAKIQLPGQSEEGKLNLVNLLFKINKRPTSKSRASPHKCLLCSQSESAIISVLW